MLVPVPLSDFASWCSTHSKARSVATSTGWSKIKGSAGTIASPVTVGPQLRSRRLDDLSKAFFACLTAVWMVKAGSALGLRTFVELGDHTAMVYLNSHRSHGLERCSFHRDETHASRFRKVSSFKRCRTASVSLVRFVTYVSDGEGRSDGERNVCGILPHQVQP